MSNAMLNDVPSSVQFMPFVPTAEPLPPVAEVVSQVERPARRTDASSVRDHTFSEAAARAERQVRGTDASSVRDHTFSEVVARAERRLAELESLWELIEIDEEPPSPVVVPKGLRVSVVIPVYNEKKTIFDVIARVRALPFETEIIVVDDCSTDGTRGWLETVRGAPGLKLILKDQNEGKGSALRSGFEAATGQIIVVQDADLEYDPRDIETVIRPIIAGEADASYGSRYFYRRNGDRSFFHRLVNRALTTASNMLTGLRLTDMETCHKAFRTCVIRDLPLKQNRFGFEPEVTAKLARRKYRVAETPSSYAPRGYAEGKKIGIRDALNAVYCIVRYGLAD